MERDVAMRWRTGRAGRDPGILTRTMTCEITSEDGLNPQRLITADRGEGIGMDIGIMIGAFEMTL
jgi:hypothetical protein